MGGEFQALSTFLKESGIAHRVSCPHTPQQNGLAERKHRHIVETGLSLLSQASLPHKFWDDAFLTATYLINLLPTKTLQHISPFERLHKHKPDYNTLKVFGCLCYPFIRPYNKHKLQYRSSMATFLGYSPSHKGYKALLPEGKVIVTRDIIFDENVFPFQMSKSANDYYSPSAADTAPTLSPNSSFVISHIPLSHQAAPPRVSDPSTSYFQSTSADPHSSNSRSASAVPPSAAVAPVPITTAPVTESSSPSPLHDSSPIIPVSDSNDCSSSDSLSIDNNNALPSTKSTHPMTTRAKAGIFKPKAFSLTLSPYHIPRNALEAILIPIWKAATLAESWPCFGIVPGF